MGGFYVGECPRISPFLKNNGPRLHYFLRNGELLGHSPIRRCSGKYRCIDNLKLSLF